MSGIALLLGLAIALACGGSDNESAVTEFIIASEGGEVSLDDGLAVRIPAGALPSDLPVTVTRSTTDDTLGVEFEGADSLGSAFNIDLGGATLTAPVTLEIPFDNAQIPDSASRELAFVAFFDAQNSTWVPVGGVVDADRDVIIVETDHLSWWNPFTWNWEAWIAVLKKTLSLNLSDFVDAVALLTQECLEDSEDVTVDNSDGNSVIKGCIVVDDLSGAGLSVTNLKSFHLGVDLRMGRSTSAQEHILAPGEALPLPTGTTCDLGCSASATFTEESMRTFVVSLVLRMLPSGDLIPNEGLEFIADGLANVITAQEISQDLQEGDSLGAAEGVFELITDATFIEIFAELAQQYGEEHGVDMMTKWTKAGVQKVLIGVAAVDVIISTFDFLANYVVNQESTVSFIGTKYQAGEPGLDDPPTTGDTTSDAGPIDFSNPESVARAAVSAMYSEDWGTYLATVKPDLRKDFERWMEEVSITDITGCELGDAYYLVENRGPDEKMVTVLFNDDCVIVRSYYGATMTVYDHVPFYMKFANDQWWIAG